jgi:hypothetical protein
MTIQDFAKWRRLKTSTDIDDTLIIAGRQGHLYEYSSTELGVIFVTPATEAPRTGFWNRLSAACKLAGMIPRQVGDAEGAFSFDSAIPGHVKLALKLADARPKRRVSEEQRAAAASRFAQYRQNLASEPLQEGVSRL